MLILYFICCVLQPICLPIPEIITILWGTELFGAAKSFMVGVLGLVIGITIMYHCSLKLSSWLIRKFDYKKQMNVFFSYIDRYQVFIIGVLFVIPILPDEIVGIGAAMIGIRFWKFIAMAIISKMISVGMITFAGLIADSCFLDKWQILMIELIILYVSTIVLKRNTTAVEGV